LGGIVDKIPKKFADRPNIPKRDLPHGWTATKTATPEAKHLLIFITPTLINADGTRRHVSSNNIDNKDVIDHRDVNRP
jgi:hypothetical protein